MHSCLYNQVALRLLLSLLVNNISVQFSCWVMSDSLWPHELQHARPPCPSPIPGVYPNSCPLSRWCHPTSHSLLSPSPPTLNLSQHQSLFRWVSSLCQVAKVLEFQLQHQSFQWTQDWSPLGWTGDVQRNSQGPLFVMFYAWNRSGLCSCLWSWNLKHLIMSGIM